MKKIKSYVGLMLTALLAGWTMTSCQDDFNDPAMNVPVATLQPNTTIADVKAEFWNDADNYIDTIRLAQNGDHVIIAGRVISSDASGNIYKNLMIQDATGALTMSINANSLYNEYRIGQEIVVDLTDMYIGKYSTLQQLGFPDYSAAYGWQATFMPLEFFKQHTQLNGLPAPSKIDTLTIDLGQLGNGTADLQKYQSQLVRLNNVYFQDGGEKSFCDASKVTTNRTLKDANGNSIIVRTSGYSNFWSLKLPAESGDVVGILSTYKSGGTLQWQLLLRSPEDLLNFGDPTLPKGTENNPYDVLDAIDMVKNGTAVSAWYTGYIVGSLRSGTETVESASDIIWGADAELSNNLIIGQTPESNSLEDCMLISLPQGSPLREYGNLRDVPENYLKQIWVLATPGQSLGMNAFLSNTGAANEFRIEGVTIPGAEGDAIPNGNGTEDSPYNPTQVLAKGADVNETGQWVSGYIVGYIPDKALDGALFTVPATSASNILIATTPDETDYTKCVPVQLVKQTAPRTALNLMDNPGNLGKKCSVYGTLAKYFLVAGVKETSNYKLDGASGGDTPNPGNALFEETFANGQGQFVIHNVNMPSALTYIWKLDETYGYMKASAYANGTSYASESWLMSPILDLSACQNPVLTFDHVVNKFPSLDVAKQQVKLAVSVDGGNWQTLTIPTWSTNANWTFVSSGNIDLSAYAGKKIKLGFCYTSADGASGTWEIKNIAINGTGSITTTADANFPGGGGSQGGGTTDPVNPPVSGSNTSDINTLTANSAYSTYTTAEGWVATNAAIQSGGDKDSNPTYKFIGGSDVRAVCLNGKTSAPGSLVSPTLTGGLSKLTFNYGFAFTDTKCTFTVNIKQGGTVVQTKTVELTSITKFEVYTFEWAVSVSGDFTIEIVNDCVSGASGNKDRVSIWNIAWEN
ncbi:MAG: DUF5689 domain-containing protein [Bacteroides sp.]|nr:DUF5689 domain-containing protein [Bacteroides sp.]MCM1413752.1 DUF5689 domain-containing protein [Bacteroides sp.]MCM1472229.1 DUF5689 domain-containing protein [Bacteroides sp.]